ncbi:DUF2663 family protein [Sporolactobacillus sp. THM7-4]|nr:DUF2663 family protein [Sporolactobacillus sp. THM7-4]
MMQMTLEALRDSGKLPDMTYEIIIELVNRKKEEEIWKKRELRAGSAFIVVFSALIIYLCFFQLNRYQSLRRLDLFFNDPVIWLTGAVSLVIAIFFLRAHSKREDAEDDFDDLRKEVIDRGNELWPREPDDRGRYETMHYLLKDKAINLFYK